MEQNSVVAMLDEEISRLRQVRTILQSLVAVEAEVTPLLVAAAAPEPHLQEPSVRQEQPETVEQKSGQGQTLMVSSVPHTVASTVARHVSRRGVATGRRGPRQRTVAAAPRPLDAAVPKVPVVVSRSALLATRPVPASVPPPAPEGTLEAWVRSLKQASPAA